MSGDAFLHDRKQYRDVPLNESDLLEDPMEMLRLWIDDARQAGAHEPNAMCLSTVDPDGKPSGRMLLARSADANGVVFFTNYSSRKGAELEANSRAAITFWWGELERQVRVEGAVERLSESESDAYFASRPYESRLASAASPQSQVVPGRAALDAQYDALKSKFPDDVPRPEHWGGYILRPESVEFWQGRPARFHDRLRYRRSNAGWVIERLAP